MRALTAPLSTPSAAELDAPDSLLNRLAGREPRLDPVCCRSEWLFSFHEAFAPRRPLHFRAAAGSLLAFAEQLHPRLGLILEPLESHWLFACPLLGPEAPALLEALLAEEAFAPRPPYVLVSGLLPGSPLVRALARRFEGFRL